MAKKHDLEASLTPFLPFSPHEIQSIALKLNRKFVHAVGCTPENASEVVATAVLCVLGTAQLLSDKEQQLWKAFQPLQMAHHRLPTYNSLSLPDFFASFSPQIQQIQRNFPSNPQSNLLTYLSDAYPLRFKCYFLDLQGNLVSKTHQNDHKTRFFTSYFLQTDSNLVLLVPKKYCLAENFDLIDGKRQIYVKFLDSDGPKDPKKLILMQKNALIAQNQGNLIENSTLDLLKSSLNLPENQVKLSNFQSELEKLSSDLRPEIADRVRSLCLELDAGRECVKCSGAKGERRSCGCHLCETCLDMAVTDAGVTLKGVERPVMCPVCDVRMTGVTAAIGRVKEEISQCSGLRYCESCEHVHSISCFPTLTCTHPPTCFFCLFKYPQRITNHCETCAEVQAEGRVGKCKGCAGTVDYGKTAEITVMEVIDGDWVATYGELCGKCLLYAWQFGGQIGSYVLSPSEKTQIASEVEVHSDCCHTSLPSCDLLLTPICFHLVCFSCLTDTKCPVCQSDLPAETLSQLSSCSVCKRVGGETLLPCGHYIHQTCFPSLLLHFQDSNCAKCLTCDSYLPPRHILPLLRDNKDLFLEFDRRFGYSFTYRCPGGTEKEVKLVDLQEMISVCQCHSLEFCMYCGLQTSSRHPCVPFEQRQAADRLLSAGKRVGQCPNCLKAQEVRAEQEWQMCECGCYFTSCCCAFYELVHYHGSAWHRGNCRRGGDAPGSGECPYCILRGEVCPKPPSLKRHRLITHIEHSPLYPTT